MILNTKSTRLYVTFLREMPADTMDMLAFYSSNRSPRVWTYHPEKQKKKKQKITAWICTLLVIINTGCL